MGAAIGGIIGGTLGAGKHIQVVEQRNPQNIVPFLQVGRLRLSLQAYSPSKHLYYSDTVDIFSGTHLRLGHRAGQMQRPHALCEALRRLRSLPEILLPAHCDYYRLVLRDILRSPLPMPSSFLGLGSTKR